MTEDELCRIWVPRVLADPSAFGLDGCLLCGGPMKVVGLFFPNPDVAKRLGQPKGKQRVVFYALCAACNDLPDKVEKVELFLLANAGVQ